MVKTLLSAVVAGIAGLWIASKTFPGTRLEDIKTLLVAGSVLGLAITVIKPFANIIVISLLFFVGIAITLILVR